MKPYSISKGSDLYFCTDTIISFAFVFVERIFFEIVIDSLKFCQKEKGLKLHAFVIMPNHVHSILSTNDSNLSNIIRDCKRFTSRKITDVLYKNNKSQLLTLFKNAANNSKQDNSFKVWQPGCHPQLMDYNKKLFQKIEYIHNNPVRKGFVDKPEHWIYSSARNYLFQDNSVINVECICE